MTTPAVAADAVDERREQALAEAGEIYAEWIDANPEPTTGGAA